MPFSSVVVSLNSYLCLYFVYNMSRFQNYVLIFPNKFKFVYKTTKEENVREKLCTNI